jgi:hypothetical protein
VKATTAAASVKPIASRTIDEEKKRSRNLSIYRLRISPERRRAHSKIEPARPVSRAVPESFNKNLSINGEEL